MDIVVRKPTEAEVTEFRKKSTWSCDVSEFNWHYDSKETCILTKGEVTVVYGNKEVSFGAGDLVVFPSGLSCVWKVTKPVHKHFEFE
jgi:uncharacterized cupin superfamily protein